LESNENVVKNHGAENTTENVADIEESTA